MGYLWQKLVIKISIHVIVIGVSKDFVRVASCNLLLQTHLSWTIPRSCTATATHIASLLGLSIEHGSQRLERLLQILLLLLKS